MGCEKTYYEKLKQLELFPVTYDLKLHDVYALVSILNGKYNANEDNFSQWNGTLHDKDTRRNFVAKNKTTKLADIYSFDSHELLYFPTGIQNFPFNVIR